MTYLIVLECMILSRVLSFAQDMFCWVCSLVFTTLANKITRTVFVHHYLHGNFSNRDECASSCINVVKMQTMNRTKSLFIRECCGAKIMRNHWKVEAKNLNSESAWIANSNIDREQPRQWRIQSTWLQLEGKVVKYGTHQASYP